MNSEAVTVSSLAPVLFLCGCTACGSESALLTVHVGTGSGFSLVSVYLKE